MKFSAEHRAFQLELREIIQSKLPQDIKHRVESDLVLHKADYVRWQKILFENGCFAKTWPKEFGGPGWDLVQQYIFERENALAGAPWIIPYGVNMIGPVLINFGTEKQRKEYLPGILSSDTWWCQGYSEPNSGSDLASLGCKAKRDGDEYVINGTKMWTTEAHYADMMHALVRTDRSGRKQEGITFLLIDMNTLGITIEPIVTIDGVHHTNQVFFDDVRVPVENLVGKEGDGWKIAKFLLEHERASIADTAAKQRVVQSLRRRIDECFSADRGSDQALLFRLRLAKLDVELQVLVELEQRLITAWYSGKKLPHEAPVLKVRATEIEQALYELGMDLSGPYASAFDVEAVLSGSGMGLDAAAHKIASASVYRYLRVRAATVYGGTNEIQRNIIASTLLR